MDESIKLSPISIEVESFPTKACSATNTCASIIESIDISFGPEYDLGQIVSYSSAVYEDGGGGLLVVVIPPRLGTAGDVRGSISVMTKEGNSAGPVDFYFTLLGPSPVVQPAEAPVAETKNVIVSLFGWGDKTSVEAHELNVTCCNAPATVEKILVNNYTPQASKLVANVTMPACQAQGLYLCRVGMGVIAQYTFQFEYYIPPTITLISPSSAFVDGRTSQTTSELGILRIDLSNVRPMVRQDEVKVSIGSMQCNGVDCAIINITSPSLDTRAIFVTIPSNPKAGVVNIVVETGVRITRPSQFTYVSLKPMALHALSCKQCSSASRCIVNGRCAKSVIPFVNRAPYSSASTVTITIDSLNILPPTSSIFVNLGSCHTPLSAWKITSSSSRVSVLEFNLPADSTNRNHGVYTINFTFPNPQISIPFPFSFFDDLVGITCTGICAAKSVNGEVLSITITNFNVSDNADIESIMFGSLNATAFSVDPVASSGVLTVLQITPPASVTCIFTTRQVFFPQNIMYSCTDMSQ
jgi:hypothetical protein